MHEQSDEVFDVFLSHPHAEAAVVEAIGTRLSDETGLKVWLDRWHLVPGEQWQQKLARGLDQARTCAVFIGGQTPTGWFKQEIQRALNRQARDPSFRVIPVILPNGDKALVDDFLELRTWVDFSQGLPDDLAFHNLVSGVRGLAPGRTPLRNTLADSGLVLLRQRLAHIRELRQDSLIDDQVAVEYQRRLLDDLLKPERR